MSRYLEEAAALLRRSSETNEKQNAEYLHNLTQGRERIAQQFATLAAIDKGLLPADITRDVLDTITRQHA